MKEIDKFNQPPPESVPDGGYEWPEYISRIWWIGPMCEAHVIVIVLFIFFLLYITSPLLSYIF
jgi:hypothetical protein